MKTQAFALLAAATLIAAPAAPASAQTRAPAAALSAQDRALVQRAGAYLQGLTTARGRFVQTDAAGRVTRGAYFLKRPGKIRFEYDAPSRLVVAADGYNVKMHDPRLNTFDQYPLSATPLTLFLARNINLDRGGVTEVRRLGDAFSITVRDTQRRAEGAITLVFSNNSNTLREWTVVDAQGRRTRVQLTNLTRGGALPDSLFVLRDPRARTAPR